MLIGLGGLDPELATRGRFRTRRKTKHKRQLDVEAWILSFLTLLICPGLPNQVASWVVPDKLPGKSRKLTVIMHDYVVGGECVATLTNPR